MVNNLGCPYMYGAHPVRRRIPDLSIILCLSLVVKVTLNMEKYGDEALIALRCGEHSWLSICAVIIQSEPTDTRHGYNIMSELGGKNDIEYGRVWMIKLQWH